MLAVCSKPHGVQSDWSLSSAQRISVRQNERDLYQVWWQPHLRLRPSLLSWSRSPNPRLWLRFGLDSDLDLAVKVLDQVCYPKVAVQIQVQVQVHYIKSKSESTKTETSLFICTWQWLARVLVTPNDKYQQMLCERSIDLCLWIWIALVGWSIRS